MIYSVIDTNVLVSALLKRGSNPDKVINLIADKKVHPLYSEKILAEYREVLGRKKKYDFGAGIIDAVTDLFLTLGTSLEAGHPAPGDQLGVPRHRADDKYEFPLSEGSHNADPSPGRGRGEARARYRAGLPPAGDRAS